MGRKADLRLALVGAHYWALPMTLAWSSARLMSEVQRKMVGPEAPPFM